MRGRTNLLGIVDHIGSNPITFGSTRASSATVAEKLPCSADGSAGRLMHGDFGSAVIGHCDAGVFKNVAGSHRQNRPVSGIRRRRFCRIQKRSY
jgi:hypothetical protein